SKEILSNVQNELNKSKKNCDELTKENSNLCELVKNQVEDIVNLESKLTLTKENLSNAQSNIKTLELGSNTKELEIKLKCTNEKINKFNGIEIQLIKVKNENSILKNKVTQLENQKQKYECKFTQSEEKLEKLFKLGKPHGDKTGLGYDKYTCHDPKFTNKFVKGESSFSSIHTNLPKTKCHYCGN
ncbi:hypothetical protein, partial [Streptomyces plicatus]|uniref:hypothetical protein n=1 Tax=Streptomyces plicatus TaxID=1922 RepID=UPI0018764DF4